MLEPDEQRALGGAWFVAIHAMHAKVGEAARPSQPAALSGCETHPVPLSVAEDVVIFQLPIDCRRFRPLQDRATM
jgi:hypothetical protein